MGLRFWVMGHYKKSHTFLLYYIQKTFHVHVHGRFLIQGCPRFNLLGSQNFVLQMMSKIVVYIRVCLVIAYINVKHIKSILV